MCRIAGIIDFKNPPSLKEITSLRDAMRHGGPDDEGVYMDDAFPLALGHRRLALIDLSKGGHQPMSDAGGDVVLIFNGEI